MKNFVESILVFLLGGVAIIWHVFMYWVLPFWVMYQFLTWLFG